MLFNDTGVASFLSPFSAHPIKWNNLVFPNTYYFYAYMKFKDTDPEWARSLLNAQSNDHLIRMSDSRRHRITGGWDSKKFRIMKRGYVLKFSQHKQLRVKLLELGKILTGYDEHPAFTYWSHHGDNMLKTLLLELQREYSAPNPGVRTGSVVRSHGSKVHGSHVDDHIAMSVDIVYDIMAPTPGLTENIEPQPINIDALCLQYDQLICSDAKVITKNLPLDASEHTHAPLKAPLKMVRVHPASSKYITISFNDTHMTNDGCGVVGLHGQPENNANMINIPLYAFKNVTGADVSDDILIKISKKLIELSKLKHICINDTRGWYSTIIQNIGSTITGGTYDTSSDAGIYTAGLIGRNPLM